MGPLRGKQYCDSHKTLRNVGARWFEPRNLCCFGGVKIYMGGKRREEKCVHVVDGGWVVYMGGYSIAPESLKAHKSCVFVKQQKLREREGAWKEKEG